VSGGKQLVVVWRQDGEMIKSSTTASSDSTSHKIAILKVKGMSYFLLTTESKRGLPLGF
jgi:hypothetical protein